MSTSPLAPANSDDPRIRIPKQWHFSKYEYQHRLERTQEEIAKAGLDGIIVHQQENIAWLTGFWHDGFFSYHAAVVPAQGPIRLVIRALELPVAVELSPITDIHQYRDGTDPFDALKRAVVDSSIGKKIGVEFDSPYLTLDRFKTIKNLLSNEEFEPIGRMIDDLRAVKTVQELNYMRKAAKIASFAVMAGVNAVREGTNELDVTAAITHAQASAGQDGLLGGLGGAIVTGWRTQLLHGQQADRIIEKGDSFRIELSGIYRQYWAKLMRAGIVGEIPDEIKRSAEIVRNAQDDAIARMGPGVSTKEIADACIRPVLDAGLADHYDNRVGYGLGLQFHPTSGDFAVDIAHYQDYPLQSGMVFHMLLFAGGAGVSETVAVTDDGYEILTAAPRETFSR